MDDIEWLLKGVRGKEGAARFLVVPAGYDLLGVADHLNESLVDAANYVFMTGNAAQVIQMEFLGSGSDYPDGPPPLVGRISSTYMEAQIGGTTRCCGVTNFCAVLVDRAHVDVFVQPGVQL